jgi:Ca2+-binding RTX toxin-like protein
MPLPIEGTDAGELINVFDGVSGADDIIWAYGGNDTIFGLGGDDMIKGGGGADAINGGTGSDTAVYIDSSVGVTVSLLTGTGAGGTAQGDTLTSIENLSGSNHNDMLIGNGNANGLFGAEGDDTLKGGGGADNLDGGGGNDTASYYYSTEAVVASMFFGWFSGGEAEGDTLTNIENLSGSGYDDVLGGTDGANTLNGLNGNDVLKGFGGNDNLLGSGGDDELLGDAGHDILNGGTGVDTMEGGTGNDTYYVDDADDELIEGAGEGSDTVLASTDYALAVGVDVETLATTNANGTADIVLFGNESGNVIIGNNGDNILKGGGGTDHFTGRLGNDIYWVDGSEDDIVESGGQGVDEVWTSGNYTLNPGADVEVLRTTNDFGVSNIRLIGNESGNIVRGNAGNNRINGGDGNDELTGLGGEDLFLFGYGSSFDGVTNIDFVTDFEVINDTIWLDTTLFAVGSGALSGDEFVNGVAAQDAEDRIIYDGDTGALYYDSDGLGGADAIQFAVLSPGLALSNANFIGVAPF